MAGSDFRKVYSASDEIEAAMVSARLAEAGIASFDKSASVIAVFGSASGPKDIYVRPEDEYKALEVLR